jgi:tetratricopeptide (TPR) repeat protein
MPRFFIAAALLGLPTAALACLWDYDTLKQERSRFPDTLEIITGKFLRHSPEFYEWRIKDRLAKLKTDPRNPALHDDLAVAYAKTGQYAKAIATMEALEKIAPGRYETYSNLGTFHFLAGDIPKALPLIDKALAINPDAHFGREKYQRWLGEYVETSSPRGSFADFLDRKLGRPADVADLQACLKGLVGMMRFANHENPYLLQALADILMIDRYGGYPERDAKRLAARAVLKKGYSPSDRSFDPKVVEKVKEILSLQYRHGQTGETLTVDELTARFKEELTDAENWYAALRSMEVGWIKSGADPEAEFDKLYTEEPRIEDEPTDAYPRRWDWARNNWETILWGIAGALLVLGLVGVWLIRRFVVRR